VALIIGAVRTEFPSAKDHKFSDRRLVPEGPNAYRTDGPMRFFAPAERNAWFDYSSPSHCAPLEREKSALVTEVYKHLAPLEPED